ncbi:MAG: flagellar basal body-associated FliL family protein [Trichlorobacter sp.]|nr:flagellar basal body-associated FliL family protein [Trichlorobacter sp.]
MAKEEQNGAETNEGGKKKLFIIIGAVALVLIIGGVAAFMMLGGKKTEAPPADGAAAAAPAAPAPVAAGVDTVFSMDPFIVNIYDGMELRYLKVKVEMEMANPAFKPELEGRLAAIRDAILVLLTTKTLQDIQDVQGKNQLREEILAAVSRIISQGKVTKVYFTDFVVQ